MSRVRDWEKLVIAIYGFAYICALCLVTDLLIQPHTRTHSHTLAHTRAHSHTDAFTEVV